MTLAEREKYAKDFVNRIRKEHGQRALGKLKRGVPGHHRCCTVAMSLPCRCADHDDIWVRLDGYVYPDPEMAKFMEDFDSGLYPHLEIPYSAIKSKKPNERKQTILAPAHYKNGELA
jgi:hypothetical protein